MIGVVTGRGDLAGGQHRFAEGEVNGLVHRRALRSHVDVGPLNQVDLALMLLEGHDPGLTVQHRASVDATRPGTLRRLEGHQELLAQPVFGDQ